MLEIELSSTSKKFLRKIDSDLAKRIIEKIESLSINPFPSDVKRVVNKKEKIFRIRAGQYRIQYSVFHNKNLILITDIAKRPRAY